MFNAGFRRRVHLTPSLLLLFSLHTGSSESSSNTRNVIWTALLDYSNNKLTDGSCSGPGCGYYESNRQVDTRANFLCAGYSDGTCIVWSADDGRPITFIDTLALGTVLPGMTIKERGDNMDLPELVPEVPLEMSMSTRIRSDQAMAMAEPPLLARAGAGVNPKKGVIFDGASNGCDDDSEMEAGSGSTTRSNSADSFRPAPPASSSSSASTAAAVSGMYIYLLRCANPCHIGLDKSF